MGHQILDVRSLWRQQLWLQFGNGVCAVLAIAWVIVVGRSLEPARAGEFFAALALATIAGAGLGAFRAALANACAIHRDHPGVVALLVRRAERSIASRGAPWAAVATLALALAAPWLGIRSSTVVAVVAAIASKVLLDLARAGMAGLGRYGELARNQMLEAVVRLAVGLPLLWLLPDATVGIAVYAVASLVARVAIARHVGSPGQHCDVTWTWPALGSLLVWNALAASAQHADTLVVTAIAPPEAAAAFGAAAALLRGFALLALPVQLHLGPYLTAEFARGRFDRRAAVHLVMLYLLTCAVPLGVCLAEPELIFGRVYGPMVAEQGGAILGPLAVGAVLVHLGITMGGMLIALGDFRFLARYASAVVLHIAIVGLAAVHSIAASAHAVWVGQAVLVTVLACELARVARGAVGRARTCP